jgi:DinB superfamily
MSNRSEALACRLEDGARALIAFAGGLSEADWQLRTSGDGRSVGVIVHHVGTMYPLEMELAQLVSRGLPVTDITWEAVHDINATHAAVNHAVSKAEAIALLQQNSAMAAAAIRAITDDALDTASPCSLYGGAPVSCQFVLEDHAVRHSWHHLAKLRVAVSGVVRELVSAAA